MDVDGRTTGSLEATARWTAAVRAREQERPDRLLDDPWAAALAGADGAAWLEGRTPESIVPIVIRTRYFDDWLRDVTADGPRRQVVLLAAGLDTRAFRLSWPAGTTVYEMDRAAVLASKAEVLAGAGAVPRCGRRLVTADLGSSWDEPLRTAGFDPAVPTAWLAEGVLFYLPPVVVSHVLEVATVLSAPGSRLGFDIVNRHVLTSPWTKAWVEMQAAAGAPWLGTMDDPAAVLAALGWAATVSQPGEPGANHGRWTLPVVPASMADLPHSWYVTAVREG